MNILIIGSKGQVGTELMALAAMNEHEATGLDYDRLDMTCQSAVEHAFERYQPQAVINAAAYTAVDKAESEVAAAMAVNATAVGYLAQLCADKDIPLLHISTDYVFDGNTLNAYSETDDVSPLGVYGDSKFQGEELVRKWCRKYYILRTSWVFSAHGNNFVKTMLRLGAEREVLGVVADQQGKPTAARAIAEALYRMLDHTEKAWGTYHFSQPESVTWHAFAEAIFMTARQEGMSLKLKTLNSIETKDYPTPAKRPKNSTLECCLFEKTFNTTIRPWPESLLDVIKALK